MKNYKFDKAHDEFGKKVLAAIPHVFPYVKHRLYVLETKGYIPKNMYKTNGIIDDAIVELYTQFEGKLNTENEVTLKLFAFTDRRINILHKKEAFHKETMSISKILDNELKLLEEKFAMDANSDLVMREELDDISYHQDDFNQTMFLYDSAGKDLVDSLEIPLKYDTLNEQRRKTLNHIYHWLPSEISNILDLFTFGKLSYDEIAMVTEIDSYIIKDTIHSVSLMFRKNIL